MNRISYVCACFILCYAMPTISTAQWNFSELINRVSQEKSKVVSYRLIQNQFPEDGTLRFARCTWIQEYSSVGDHHVVAVVQRNEKGEPTFWGLRGRSDDISISGSSDGGEISISRFNPDDEGKVPKHLDWRLMGLGFCGDIGDTFESVAKNVASWDKSAGDDARFFNTKTGLEVEYAHIRIESEIAEDSE